MPNSLTGLVLDSRLFKSTKTGSIQGGRAVNRLSRLLGLEVELSDWGGFKNNWVPVNFTWQKEHDGSVVPSGEELIISPMGGDQFVAGVVEVLDELVKVGAGVNNSCGLHVHVDARDYSYWDLRRLLWVYVMLEDSIYRVLVEPGRDIRRSYHGWLFCGKMDQLARDAVRQLGQAESTKEIKSDIQKMVYSMDPTPFKVPKNKKTVDKDWRRAVQALKKIHVQNTSLYLEARRQKYGGRQGSRGFLSRYMGLNIHSWFHRGTIEWRMKEGTLDIGEMLYWSLFCGWVVELAQRMNDRLILPGLGRNNGGYGDILKHWELVEFVRCNMPKSIFSWVQQKMKRVSNT